MNRMANVESGNHQDKMKPNLEKDEAPTRLFFGHILAIEINDFLPGKGNQARSRARVIPNILHLLDHIDKHRAEGNFYIVPDIAQDFPEIVSLVSSRGHEIGLCCDYSLSRCRGDIRAYRTMIEEITKMPMRGVMIKCDESQGRLQLRKMADLGFSYCIINFRMSLREEGSLPLQIEYPDNLSIKVFPPSTYRVGGIDVAFGSPGKIRLYPFWFLRKCLRHYACGNKPAVINFPLWEFDPHLPRKVLSPLQSLRSYGNLSLAEFKLTRMLLEFDFTRIPRIIGIEDTEDT